MPYVRKPLTRKCGTRKPLTADEVELQREKRSVRMRYKDACNDYLRLFCQKHDFTYDPDYWAGGDVGDIIEVDDYYYVNLDTMRYDIDNDIAAEEFVLWYAYCQEVKEHMNFENWCKGAPRLTDEEIEEQRKKRMAWIDDFFKEKMKNENKNI